MARTVRFLTYEIRAMRRAHSMTLQLKHDKAFVNHNWVAAESGRTFQVFSPSSEEVVSTVPDMDENDAAKAIQAAHKAFLTWGQTTGKERSVILRKWYELLVTNQEELVKLNSTESGKPLCEAQAEVSYGNSLIEWFSEEARRIHGQVISSPVKTKEIVLIRQPLGVVSLITPWNFPHAMITRKAGAALAAGCTCVIKPAEDTPLTALALAKLAAEAGVPPGVINVVTCDRPGAAAVGRQLCQHPLVAGISFTGSTAVGKLLYSNCAAGVKRIALELGGNAPFIVFSGADLDKAVDGAIACKFRNSGQTCISANRFLVQEDVFDEFVNKLEKKMKDLVLGDPLSTSSRIGPLINLSQTAKVIGMVNDAIEKGAEVRLGGKLATSLGQRFCEPTLLLKVDPSMLCYNQEIFGPVVVCVKFKTEEEALSIANSTKSGLAGYFYTNDINQAWRVAKALSTGMVGINEGLISTAEAAFGGIKESGFGREGCHHGIDEFSYVKYLCFGLSQL
ncbi:succinate-semialdehyde dehydrogenase, mitochondrial-like isoform X2 [Bacillus rossius redtenbacheri]|uniref:succinate-semialdehyde dehydrogenase, mitochondrial-like isoform X2 n=1 Tax=Bacillus rossius redtenbacheri TaxID=93214 RepID=UPI002FDD6A31